MISSYKFICRKPIPTFVLSFSLKQPFRQCSLVEGLTIQVNMFEKQLDLSGFRVALLIFEKMNCFRHGIW